MLKNTLAMIAIVAATTVGASAHDKGNEAASIALDQSAQPRPVMQMKVNDKEYCTATYIGNNRFLTAGHCAFGLMPTDKITFETVGTNNKGSFTFRATEFVNAAPQNGTEDFAMFLGIKDITKSLTGVPLDCKSTPSMSEQVVVEGFPEDLGRTRVEGMIASYTASPWAPEKGGWSHDVWRMELPISYGNSGSVVVDKTSGKIIGLAVGALPNNRTLTVMQPIGPVCDLLGLQ